MTAAALPDSVVLSASDLQDPPQRQTQLDLSMSGRGYQPRLGLPDFIVPAGDDELAQAARTVAEVLWADLDFEKEFYMIPREESARIPTAASPQALPAQRWAQLGADFVLIGTVRRRGEEFEVDLRSIAVRGRDPGSQHFGRQYQGCTAQTPRACAHYIADDFHKETRGLDGVAQTRLAFVSNRDGAPVTGRPMPNPGASKEIYVADYDGANQRRVTANQKLNIAPSWSPDARSLAYTSWESGFQDIYVIHPFGGGPRSRPAAGDEHIHNMLSAWSPDGQRLAFSSARDGGRTDVWVVNRDGSGLRNLTPNTPNWDDSAPTWSPDGTQIAFQTDRSGNSEIYVMDADGTDVRNVSNSPGSQEGDPDWSPDGDMIVFWSSRASASDIYTMNADGSGVSRLTTTGTDSAPAWGPCTRIVFYSSRDMNAEIYVMTPDGLGQARLTNNAPPGNTLPEDFYPDCWQP